LKESIIFIAEVIVKGFAHIWPYLLITIPLSVAVHLSGASKYIKTALQTRPVKAILLATLVGAFSPFCSCGVIPVVAALLIGGVPLAPVMSFWIASPSMDPEIFFLSVGMIGWNLAIWRLVATLVISLTAGFVTQLAIQRKWIGTEILRDKRRPFAVNRRLMIRNAARKIGNTIQKYRENLALSFSQKTELSLCTENCYGQSTCCTGIDNHAGQNITAAPATIASPSACGCVSETSFSRRLWQETVKATGMVLKFMVLAFFLEALITLYIPSGWISGLLGRENAFSIFTAVFVGIPMYTSNLTALPIISGLLSQGMNPAAALAFLIAGPTTTLPAMAAVWGITHRRVFALYVLISLTGALLFGLLYRVIVNL